MDELKFAGHMARSDRMKSIEQIIDWGAKIKKIMLDKGKRKVRVKCPDHPDKFVHARLAGPRNHMHFACDVKDCRFRMME